MKLDSINNDNTYESMKAIDENQNLKSCRIYQKRIIVEKNAMVLKYSAQAF